MNDWHDACKAGWVGPIGFYRGVGMRIYLSIVAVAAIGLGLTVAAPAQAVTTISSSAYGVSANVSLTLLSSVTLNAAAGPINPVGGSAGAPYSITGTVASAGENLNLGTNVPLVGFFGVRQQLDTGLLTSSAQSPYQAPFTASQIGSAQAQIDDLGFSLAAQLSPVPLLSLIGISADTIFSQSSVSGGTTPDAIGFTQIEGLTLSGSLFSSQIIANAAAGAYLNPTANFNLLTVSLLGQDTLRIILNEQTSDDPNPADAANVSTNAIRIIFANYTVAGLGSLNGDIVIAHSQARIVDAVAEVPEPATWAQMIAGFALIGVLARRTRRRIAA